jgi:predicted transcriptional regulator
MGTERLDAEMKIRVTPAVKQALVSIASERHLDVSDIAREAFREYLSKQAENGKPDKARKPDPQLAWLL